MGETFADVDFQSINDESELKSIAEYVSMTLNEAAGRDEKTHRQTISELLGKVHAQITSPSATPKSKLMSLLLLREFTEKHAQAERKEDKHSKLFSILASHAVLRELKDIAEEVDPLKQVHEKGKGYFPTSSATGNDFLRLVLELLRFWAARFPATSKKEPTTYKRFYDELCDRKVIFPSDYKFLSFANKKTEEGMYDTGRARPADPAASSSLSPPPPTSTPQGGSSRSTVKSEIYRMHTRLINFVETLDEEIAVVEPEIRTVHAQIKSEQRKYELMQEEVVEMAGRDNDADIVAKYFAISEFMNKELQFHQQYISNSNDYQSYILAIKLEAEKNFPELNEPNANGNRNGHGNSNGNNRSNLPPAPPSKPQEKRGSKPSVIEEERGRAGFDPKATVQVSSYFNKLEQRSKSPITGFKKINESLSREKSSTLKRSVSPITRSKNNITKSMASLKESKISPIFSSPPNLRPPPKTYEGRVVRENEAVGAALRAISKSQGLRRFKTANFKGKSSLFESEHLQIGYKSEAVYEEVSGFKVLIRLELYFGNLTDDRIQNLALDFKGDPNLLLYASPRAVETSLLRGDQNKIELIVVPLKVPFPLLTMALRYDIRGEAVDHRVVLPNSVLKLAHYMGVSKEEFGRRWQGADVLRSAEAHLCHHLPPDAFTKWIPELAELTSYTAFAAPGSTKDYELFCAVIMMQRHEALLKINVRPNLDVVLQLALEDRNEEASQYFQFFLETLQQLVKEVA